MKPAFVHTGKLPDMNGYDSACRAHWGAAAKIRRETREELKWEMIAQKVPRYAGKLHIHFAWHEPPNRGGKRRDLDNIGFARKCVLDAMQDAHVIANDDERHVVRLSDELIPEPKGAPYVLRVYIQEVELPW